ncbi:Flp family type IVb pilin [Qipengyuania oceanensis]|uniref:Flp family type IVb pilin n=1 Tax=Qipengyuania oceanensis TaxID=1463597 RepID=UPI00301CBBF5
MIAPTALITGGGPLRARPLFLSGTNRSFVLDRVFTTSPVTTLTSRRQTGPVIIHDLLRDETGATAIEYALIAALVSVAAIIAIQGVGSEVNSTFQTAQSKMEAANNL